MIDLCARAGSLYSWSPLTAGTLARPGSLLDHIAQQHHAHPSQIALAWLLERSKTMLPIPGTASVQHLEENALGATITLTQEEYDAMSATRAKGA